MEELDAGFEVAQPVRRGIVLEDVAAINDAAVKIGVSESWAEAIKQQVSHAEHRELGLFGREMDVFVFVRKIPASDGGLEATNMRTNLGEVHLLPSGGVDELYHASRTGLNERAA